MHSVKRWGLAAGAGITVSVIGLVAAFACTSLASLNLSQAAGSAGTEVTVTGSSFNPVAAGNSAVTLHWSTISGPVLAENLTPDASGAIGPVTVTVPSNVAPGYYAIIATQVDGSSVPSFGTPARAAFEVTAPSGAANSNPATGSPAGTTNVNGSGLGAGMTLLLAVLAASGLVLFGVGAATFVGSYRKVPSATRMKRP